MNRQRYLEEAELRVGEIRERIAYVKCRLAGRIERNEQLQKAQQQVDSFVDALSGQIQKLPELDDDSWQEGLEEFEQTWDGLIDSLRNMVARFTN